MLDLRMNFHDVLPAFGDLLNTRLGKSVFTTEDSVRYTLFAAILERTSLRPEEIVLEQPHPSIQRAQIDTWILPTASRRGIAIEFKYDREIPSSQNTPRTQKAGKVFHDLYRLGLAPANLSRIFVYLSGSEMSSYFLNQSNGLAGFFSLPASQSLKIDATFLHGRSNTFTQACSQVPDVAVKLIYSRSLPRQHELRVFEVTNIESPTEV